jgi:hypothetical protein
MIYMIVFLLTWASVCFPVIFVAGMGVLGGIITQGENVLIRACLIVSFFVTSAIVIFKTEWFLATCATLAAGV